EFNVKSINAAQIYNIANGSTNLFPIIGAIVADSFLGSFAVAAISASISLLVILLLCCNLLQDAFLLRVCLLLCLLHSLLQLIDLLTVTNSALWVCLQADAQIYNIANGSTNFFPIIGAIVADSFLGSFAVAAISASISLLMVSLIDEFIIG
ncbi:protein nrt1/ ptr family 2.3, partial [Quercus suber]